MPELRSYQRRALREFARAYAEGKRRILMVSPTGSGKSTMGAAISANFLKRRPEDHVAWFAHRRELIRQAAETLESFGLEPGYNGMRKSSPVQIASVVASLRREEVPPAQLRIFDEAHHFMAPEWGLVFDAYTDGTSVGLTATPERADGRAMGDRFDHLIVVAQNAEMVEHWRRTEGREGIVPCEVHRPPKPQRPGYIAEQPIDALRKLHLVGKRTVVFAPSISECERMAKDCEAKGAKAHVVHDKLSGDERDKRLADFASGKVKILLNVFLLTEGWDCPSVEVVCLARRFGSIGPMMQTIGRGRRPCENKDLCTVLDLAGVTHVLGDPDEDRIYSLDGRGISRSTVAGPVYCKVCGKQIPPDSAECPNCGRERDPAEELKSSGDPLEKFARYQVDDDHTRAVRLARFMQQAIERGSKKQSGMYRYKGMYFAMPTSRIISEADAILRNRPWCRECGHHKEDDGRCRCKRAV